HGELQEYPEHASANKALLLDRNKKIATQVATAEQLAKFGEKEKKQQVQQLQGQTQQHKEIKQNQNHVESVGRAAAAGGVAGGEKATTAAQVDVPQVQQSVDLLGDGETATEQRESTSQERDRAGTSGSFTKDLERQLSLT
ncbi:unnamed protein product, partial [Amoebophrya sp. A120]